MLLMALASSVAMDALDERLVLHKRTAVPPQWSVIGRAHPKQMLHVKFALQQQNLDVLESKFWSVSDPSSPDYGKFMSISEINQMVYPAQSDVVRVLQWILSAGVQEKNVILAGDVISAKFSVKSAEKLFQTEMYGFAHEHGRSIIR